VWLLNTVSLIFLAPTRLCTVGAATVTIFHLRSRSPDDGKGEPPRLMPTMDRKHGTGAAVFDTGSNAEAGLKNKLDGRRTEAQPVVSSLTCEIVAGGRRWLQAASMVR
jgi:hypothetical protein